MQTEENNVEKESVDTTEQTMDETPKAETGGAEDFKAKYEEVNDRYLRLYSEFDNYRRRTAKERLELIGTASEEVVKNMLSVLDDMDRAIIANEKIDDIQAVKEGFLLVQQKMKNILTQKGLKEMSIADGVFNPDFHEAITKIPAPTEDLKGKVIDTIEKGYYLHDKIIRFAKVVVGE